MNNSIKLKNLQVFVLNEEGRRGSDEDVTNLNETLRQFGENIVIKTCRGTREEIVAKVNALENDETERKALQQVDGLIVVVMCHSRNTNQIIIDFYKPLRRILVQDEKLLLLIIQSCRGKCYLVDRETDGAPTNHIICFASTEDTRAPRTTEGSPFIQNICQHLLNGARDGTDVSTIIKKSTLVNGVSSYRAYYNEQAIKFYLPRIN